MSPRRSHFHPTGFFLPISFFVDPRSYYGKMGKIVLNCKRVAKVMMFELVTTKKVVEVEGTRSPWCDDIIQ